MNVQRKLASTQLKPVLLGVLLATSAWSQAAPPEQARQSAPPTLSSKQYSVTSASIEALKLDPPKLPDLSGYTHAAVEAKIRRKPGGRIAAAMLQQTALKDFTGGSGRLREWIVRQGGMPHAIFIEGGYVELGQLARQLPANQFAETTPGVYVARVPIVVAPGATLHIGKNVKELRLSEERGAFLVNDGKLFITDTKLVGWSEKNNAPSAYRGPESFWAFLVSWGGTETYISRRPVASLGYNTSKAYGVSITQYTPEMHKRLKRPRPTGWLIDSVFEDIYYGFYCYEADDVVLKGNTYRDNIIYGIDPHDRSERLVIAENHVYGTKKKHGIIVSREVNNSWIINNRTHDNKLSGIVLDRNSEHNLVAYNEVYQNHSDGITLYESSNNLIWGNRLINNARHGIRMRNSVNIRIYENLSVVNQLTGIYGHIKDLSSTDRDFKLDPFDTKVSMIVVGGQLTGNGSSPISVDSPLSLELYRVEMLAPTKSSGLTFTGILEDKQEEILDLLVRRQKAVLIDPVVDLAQAEL
uniref:Mannuronan C5-epimerase AlgG n=1 Tax=Azotobacter vinelandii TaxID=354 RepID=ALGG_AZOVI|nr:RecName: Full=Mannuronan C5-epimerase AlgG; AltName: Full=Poly(beta-D-mannuronate) C5 epimerase; Flags: Precursor [Azotobacter vinelandii]CAA61231.1 epimerase [Azotobacter vinelandii]